jgi:hypothetical protein
MAKTIANAGTYSPSGITITNAAYLPLTVDGTLTITGTIAALYVDTNTFGEITNNGELSGAHGILLSAGGDVVNRGQVTGAVNGAIDLDAGGTVSNYGVITANGTGPGIYVNIAFGNVYNKGQINASHVGVEFKDGGTINNLGTISSPSHNAVLTYGIASLSNAGLIISNAGTNSAVSLHGGGSLFNKAGGTISGPTHNGIYIDAAGVTNAYVSNAGVITGYHGVQVSNGSGSLSNSGVIIGLTKAAVDLLGGGSLTNNLGGTIASQGTADGVYTNGGLGTVLNSGLISVAAGGLSGIGLETGGFASNASSGTIASANHDVVAVGVATFINAGVISSTGTSAEIVLQAGGTVINQAGGMVLGPTGTGVYVNGTGGQTGTVLNAGSIIGGTGTNDGIRLVINSYVSNAATGLITGDSFGVHASGATATVVNAGVIAGAGPGVQIDHGGIVVNRAGGYISGADMGALILGGAGTVVNAGTFDGGVGGLAVSLAAGFADRVVVDPGAVFTGAINGGNIAGSPTTSTLEFAAGSGGLAGLGTTITNFSAIQFDAGAAWTIEGTASGLAGPISGFAAGDTIVVDNFTATGSSYLNNVLTLTNATGQVTLDLPSGINPSQLVVEDVGSGTDVVLACFAEGTFIDTPGGPVRIEDLRIGDMVLAHDGDAGGPIGPQPIVWIGHRTVDANRQPEPATVWPIRISAGALGAALPRRDLFLSPYHSLFLHGVLIPVKLLVNGHCVVQMPTDRITYYHVELPAHGVVLAEGVEAESYLNSGDRSDFAEGGVIQMFPAFTSHLWEACGCARLVMTGPELDAARALLAPPPAARRGGRRGGKAKPTSASA